MLLRDGGLLRLLTAGAEANPLMQWAVDAAAGFGLDRPPPLLDPLALPGGTLPAGHVEGGIRGLALDAPYLCGFAFFARLSGHPLATHVPRRLSDPLWRQRWLLAEALAIRAGRADPAAEADALVRAAGGPAGFRALHAEADPAPLPGGERDAIARLSEDLGQTIGALPADGAIRIAVHRRLEQAIGPGPRPGAGWPRILREAAWRALLAPAMIAARLDARRRGEPVSALPDPTAWPALLPPVIEHLRRMLPLLPGTLGASAPGLDSALDTLRAAARPLLRDTLTLEWLAGHQPDLALLLGRIARGDTAGLRPKLSRFLAETEGRNLVADHL